MPKRKDWSKERRPSVSFAVTPVSEPTRWLRIHGGIMETTEDIEKFIAQLDLYANQKPTDYKRNYNNTNPRPATPRKGDNFPPGSDPVGEANDFIKKIPGR